MSGASSDGEINHWPGFVDALTTIIMVVTFLLIILGATVFVMSKKIVEQVKMELISKASSKVVATADVESLKKKLATAEAEIASLKRATSPLASPKDAENGTSIADMGGILRQDKVVNGEQRLTIRTRDSKDTEHIKVLAEEAVKDTTGAEVKSAHMLLNIDFAARAVTYTDDNTKQISSFLSANSDLTPSAHFEIWSYAPTTTSVSEAERLAYYRALMTRNLLIKNGIPPQHITAQIRTNDQTQQGNSVKVVIKP